MKEKIIELLKSAMKEKNMFKTTVYRSLKSDIETSEKNGNNDVINILIKASKRRIESIDQYNKANRFDLAEIESKELEIIKELLPKEPTKEEIENCINECFSNISMKMGEVIKYVKYNYPMVDGKTLSQIVKDKLK